MPPVVLKAPPFRRCLPIQDRAKTPAEIADAIGVGAAKLSPLLYALVEAGLLTVNHGKFANTAEAQHYLVRGLPTWAAGTPTTPPDGPKHSKRRSPSCRVPPRPSSTSRPCRLRRNWRSSGDCIQPPWRRIGKTNGIFAPPLPPLASGPPSPAAAAHSQRWRLPQHAAAACEGGVQLSVAWLCAVWTCRARWGTLRTQGFPGARASERPVRKAGGGDDFKRDCKTKRGERHRSGGRMAAMMRREGQQSCPAPTQSRREPRRQNGHVAISRSKTRPSSLAQFQYGVPVFDSSPPIPC